MFTQRFEEKREDSLSETVACQWYIRNDGSNKPT